MVSAAMSTASPGSRGSKKRRSTVSQPPHSMSGGKLVTETSLSQRACDRCYRRACKCSPGIEGRTCTRCTEEGVMCTYNRPVKRRGPPSRRARTMADSQTHVTAALELPLAPVSGRSATEEPRVTPSLASSFFSMYDGDVVKPEMIEKLAEVFYYASYPTRPYVHWPTYQAQIQNQVYRSDWGIYVVTMAVCAMSAGRLSHGLSLPSVPGLSCSAAADISARCYAAAVRALPPDITAAVDHFQMMKASAMLASVCLQNGDLKKTLSHLGDYTSLSVLHGFYDEANWPKGLTEVQRQERRRLFWGVYQQEQYVSNDYGLISRQREAQATVLYPAEVFDDEDITDSAIRFRTERVSFLRGWNFCTDLYRLLENINSSTRARQHIPTEEPDYLINSFLLRLTPPKHFAADSLHFISKQYSDLPSELKKVKAITENPQIDRYGFIASNILITTQMLKMLLVGSETPNVHQRCAIASELLDELSTVPLAFFHATSMASLRHLAHVGHMLACVIRSPLSAWTYLQARSILLVLADFFDKIVSANPTAPNLSKKLRTQIDRIDQCMKQTSHQSQEPGLLSVGQNMLLDWRNTVEVASSSNQQQQQTSPSRSVRTIASGSQPPDVGHQRTSDVMQQEHQQQLAQSTPVNADDDAILQQPTFQPPVSDFILQQENLSMFSVDPFDNWLLSLEHTQPFEGIGSYSSLNAACNIIGPSPLLISVDSGVGNNI